MSTKKPLECHSCPLSEKGKGFVVPFPPTTKPRLLIQGEAPGRSEMEEGRPFVGEAGHWLRRNILTNAGVREDEVLIDNTLRCLLAGKSGNYPTGKDREAAESHCRQFDLWDQYPDVPLLLVGAKAIGQYMDDDRVSRWHGDIRHQGKRLVGATYHPAAVMRNPNLLPLVIQEVRNLLKAAENPKLLERPNVRKGFIWQQNKPFTFDLEWSEDGTISVLGVSYANGEAYSTFLSDELGWLNETIRRGSVTVSGHNIITADLPMLGYFGEDIYSLCYSGRIKDTMIMAHLVHPHYAELGLYGLSDMVKFYEPVGEWKDDKSDILTYNGRDAAYNWLLDQHLTRDLAITKQEHLLPKRQKLAALTVAMKQRGIKIDTKALDQYARERQALRDEIKASFSFNPNSPKQIKEWAEKLEFGPAFEYSVLGIPSYEGKERTVRSRQTIKLKDTTYETLKKYEGKHPEMDKLIDYREDSKSLSTWFPVEEVEGTLACTAEFIFPTFHVTGTAVGRPSCSDPNILNIPEGGVRQMSSGYTRDMPNLRRFLIPRDPGLHIVSFDFSSIEHRTLAIVFEDHKKLKDLATGIKTYTRVAAEHWNKRLEDVTKDEYRMAKTIVLATDYCETPFNLATRVFGDRTRDSVLKATRLQNSYFRTYPATKAGQDRVGRQLDSGDLGLRNPFGGFRRVFAQNSHERKKRGVHFLGCSTAAELVNQRMLDIYEELKLVPFQWCYDELAYELEIGDMKTIKLIWDIMERPCSELGGYVIPVECKTGPNYGALKELKYDVL